MLCLKYLKMNETTQATIHIPELSVLAGQIKDLQEELAELKKQVKTQPDKQYHHINDVIKITGLSRAALKGRNKRGKIVLVTDGNEVLMHNEDLQQLLGELDRKRQIKTALNKA